MTFQALPGFRDFPPEDLALRSFIFAAWRRVATRYGFEEYDGPPLEPLDLYTAKSGNEIVGQLYNFVDKGDRQVALRPEMTPTLARMVAARANGLKKPIRWFSIPQLFRYERQQRGRLREHFQLNCDLIGEAGPLADAEVIALAIDIMRELGLTSTDVRVRVSDRRVLRAMLEGVGVRAESLAGVFSAIDRIEKDRAGALLLLSQHLGMGGYSTPEKLISDVVAVSELRSLSAILERIPTYQDDVSPGADFQATLSALDAMGLGDWIDVDMTIVRGLAYYTGTVFELFDASKSLRAICGGGRYDDLTSNIGGVELPAVGFGMGDVVIGELLKDRGKVSPVSPPVQVFLATSWTEEMKTVLNIAHRLRDAGVRVEFTYSPSDIKKQLKFADARKAQLVVFVALSAVGEIKVLNREARTEERVSLDAVVEHVKQVIHSTRIASHNG